MNASALDTVSFRSVLAAFVLLLATAGTSHAQSLSGASVVKNAGNSADSFQDGLTVSYQRTTTVGFTSTSATLLRTRYAEVVGVDVGTLSSQSLTQNSDYTISFNVTAPGAYDLNVTTSLNGAFTIVDDGDGPGTANASAVTGSQAGGTLVVANSLNLSDPGGPVSSGNSPFHQTSSATIQGTSNGVAKAHSLRFTWSASCSSSNGFLTGGDECAVRLGIPISYAGESAGDYPGAGGRVAANDGHFVTISLFSLCGDGVVQGSRGEQCDLGSGLNGQPGTCCTSACKFVSSGTVCRAAGGVCDLQEVCSGSSGTCPGDAKSTAQCRASAGDCDVAEFCNGVSNSCPANGFKSAATVCRASAGGCDPAENCTGSSATCPADAKRPNGFVCRAAAGICDVAETCDGVSNACPSDAFAPASTVCRAASTVCDVAESCTGGGPSCPSDAVQPAGTVCNPAVGVCDEAEVCNGSTKVCPPDAFLGSTSGSFVCRPAAGPCDKDDVCDGTGPDCPTFDGKQTVGTVCRAAAGLCDLAELCNGVSNACPPDGFLSAATVCRASAGDCDLAENCTGSSAACPSDAKSTAVCRAAAGACDLAESCDGVSDSCPTDEFEPASTVCRPEAGDCDVEETCTGSSATCPADAVESSGTVCRPAAGICDEVETCDGVAADCPADAFIDSSGGAFVCRPAAGPCDVEDACDGSGPNCPAADAKVAGGTVCRAAGGVCDLEEACDGVNDACPADAKSTAECRAAAGDCDAAESCDGVSDACPADALLGAGTLCRAAVGTCDVDELCTGSDVDCPADAVEPSSTECRPAVDVCDVAEFCDGVAGTCPADVGETDSDSDGFCDDVDICPSVPDPLQLDSDSDGDGDECDVCNNIAGTLPFKTKLQISKLVTPPGDDRLVFKGFFDNVPSSPTIDPIANGIRIVLEDDLGTIMADALIPGGAYDLFMRAGWKANSAGTSFKYKNKGSVVPLDDGIIAVVLKALKNPAGRYKFIVKGKTGSYAVGQAPVKATLVFDTPLATTGQCGEATFSETYPVRPSCRFVSNGNTLKCQ